MADITYLEDMLVLLANLVEAEWHAFFTSLKWKEKQDYWLNLLNEIRLQRIQLMKELGIDDLPDESHCFTGNTLIIANPETKQIKEIKVGDKVLTHEGRFMPVIATNKRKYKGKMYRIYTYYNNIPLEVTPEHPFLCLSNIRVKQKNIWRKNFTFPKPVWKKAENLVSEDFLLFPRWKNKEKNFFIVKYFFRNSHFAKGMITKNKIFLETIKKKVEINNKLMELIGLYLAEGCHIKGKSWYKKEKRWIKKDIIVFSFGKHEKNLIQKTIKLFKEAFDYEPKLLEKRTCIDLRTGKRNITHFFAQFGDKANNKHIPGWILLLPPEKVKYLIKGMIEGDGSIGKYDISYSTVSEKLAYSFRNLLLNLGFLASIKKQKTKGKSVIEGRKVNTSEYVYTISVSGDSARNLAKFLGINYDGGKKTSGNFGYVTDKYLLIPIKKIEEFDYEGDVYNLQVLGDETYTTLSGVVHNCEIKHLFSIFVRNEEVGTRYLKDGNIEKAKEYFRKAFIIFNTIVELVLPAYEKRNKNSESKAESKAKNILKKAIGIK